MCVSVCVCKRRWNKPYFAYRSGAKREERLELKKLEEKQGALPLMKYKIQPPRLEENNAIQSVLATLHPYFPRGSLQSRGSMMPVYPSNKRSYSP